LNEDKRQEAEYALSVWLYRTITLSVVTVLEYYKDKWKKNIGLVYSSQRLHGFNRLPFLLQITQTKAVIGEREGKTDNLTRIELLKEEERRIQEELQERKEEIERKAKVHFCLKNCTSNVVWIFIIFAIILRRRKRFWLIPPKSCKTLLHPWINLRILI